MNVDKPLFEGKRICLAHIDREEDAEIESRWTHDAAYLRMLGPEPARPLFPAQLKKKYEAIEKAMDKDKDQYYFTVRMRENGRLVGFARLFRISWTHGYTLIQLGIGEVQDRGKGYGRETLSLLLQYAFEELNLYRVGATIPEYNQQALQMFQSFGFLEEVRRRQAIARDARRWDLIHLGLLKEEWQSKLDN
ncbi:MAG: GNAT family N-acetyltransferase [Anaerolineales bacterium]|nr:MAG: GNAT family N-acetyltransferase [Anaerolineales bacterium]